MKYNFICKLKCSVTLRIACRATNVSSESEELGVSRGRVIHGKKKCDLMDPGSLRKAHSSYTIQNCSCMARAYLPKPCRNHVKYDCCIATQYYVVIEHQFIIVLNGNLVNCALYGSLLIVQQQSTKPVVLCKVVLHELQGL